MARGARRSGQKQGLLARLRRSDAARPAELSEEPNELSTPAATHDSGTADEQDKATEAPATAGGAVPPGPHSEGTFYDELPWEAEHARQGEEAEHARQEAYEHGYDDRYDDGYEELYLPEEDWAHIPEQGWAPEHGTYVYPGQVGPAYRAGATYPGLVPTGRAKAARPAGPWPRLVMVAAVAVVAAAVTLALTPPRTSKPLAQATAESTTAPSRSSSTTTAPKTTTTTAPTTTAPDRTTTTARPHPLAKNLFISAATKRSLVATWLATNPGGVGLGPKDVAGTAPGQVYYAYDVPISTYFAVVAFQPSTTLVAQARTAAGKEKLRQFSGYDYVFSLQTGSTWTLLGPVPKANCPGEWVPAPVLAVWGMCGFSARTG
jgi:hypothetical protein